MLFKRKKKTDDTQLHIESIPDNCVSSVFFLRLNNIRPVILFVFQNCFFFSALITTI